MKMTFTFLIPFLLWSCSQISSPNLVLNNDEPLINSAEKTLSGRINPPAGYSRLSTDTASFTYYLRNLKLKPDGSPVKLYNGENKSWQDVHVAVVDMEIGNKDLQQCADACIRLRA